MVPPLGGTCANDAASSRAAATGVKNAASSGAKDVSNVVDGAKDAASSTEVSNAKDDPGSGAAP